MNERSQDIQRVRFSTILQEKELWILIVLGILYFYRPLLLGETFFYRDLFSTQLPQKQLFVELVKAGELPLWDPYLHGGEPYLADIQFSTFYPLNLIYFLLPVVRAFNINIVFHVIACSVCAYLLARMIRLQPVSSLITGIVFAYCGYTLSFVSMLNRLQAMPYWPLLIVFWHLFLLEKKRKWFVIAVIVGGIQVLTGAPEAIVLSLLSLLGWILCYPYPNQPLLRRMSSWCLLGVCIGGLTAFQLLPTFEMITQSSRTLKVSYSAFCQWSLHPEHLPELVFPNFLGYIDTLFHQVNYWGAQVVDGTVPYILSIYIGWVTLVLAGCGGFHQAQRPGFPRQIRLFLFAVFGVSLLLSFGRFLPFFHLVYQYVPFVSLFRYPIKFLSGGILSIALLAGYAADVHFGADATLQPQTNDDRPLWRPSFTMVITFWGVAGILLTMTVLFRFSDQFANALQAIFFKRSRSEVARQGVNMVLLHASASWLLFTLLYQYRRLQRRQWQPWLLACILISDLLPAGIRVNPTVPEHFLIRVPPVVQSIRNDIGHGRLFRAKLPDTLETSIQVPAQGMDGVPPDQVAWWWLRDIEILNETLPASYRIPILFHVDFDGLAQRRLIKLRDLLYALPWEQRLPILSASNVTLILTSEDLKVPGLSRINQTGSVYSPIPLILYRNTLVADRTEFVTDWRWVNSDDEVLNIMRHPEYDSRKHVILQQPESTLFERYPELPRIARPAECSGSGQITTRSANTLSAVFAVSNPCDGYLVFAEPFYPGWRVSVDDKVTPIERANYAFSAIFVPAGTHEIRRVYRPTSLMVGAFISAVFLCGLLVATYKR
jgi:hypothetical protein